MNASQLVPITLSLDEDTIFFYRDNYYLIDHVQTKRQRVTYICYRLDVNTGQILTDNVLQPFCESELTPAFYFGTAYQVKAKDFDSKRLLNRTDADLLKFQAWHAFFNALENQGMHPLSTREDDVLCAINSVNWAHYNQSKPAYKTATGKITKVRRANGDVYTLLPKKYRKTRGKSTLPAPVYNEMMSYIMDHLIVFNAKEKIVVAKIYDNFCKHVKNLSPEKRAAFKKIPCIATFYNHVEMVNQVLLAEKQMSYFELKKFKRKQTSKFIIKRVLERVEMDAVHLAIGIVEEVQQGRETKKVYIGKVILMVALDVFSRSVLGYSYKIDKNPSECGDLAISCLKDTLLPKTHLNWPMYGRCENLVVDQGTAGTGNQLQEATSDADMGLITTPAGSPWRKPFIERFFLRFRTDFMTELSSYIASKRHKNHGGIDQDQDIEVEAMLTEAQFVELLEDYIANTYHVSRHDGLNERSPLDVWNDAMSEYGQDVYTLPLDHKVFIRRGNYAPKRVISELGTVTILGQKYFSHTLKKLQLEGVKTVDVYYGNDDVYSVTFSHEHLLYVATLIPTNSNPEPYEGQQRASLVAANAHRFGHLPKSPIARYSAPDWASQTASQRPKTGEAETRAPDRLIDTHNENACETLQDAIAEDMATHYPLVNNLSTLHATTGADSTSIPKKPTTITVKKGGIL